MDEKRCPFPMTVSAEVSPQDVVYAYLGYGCDPRDIVDVRVTGISEESWLDVVHAFAHDHTFFTELPAVRDVRYRIEQVVGDDVDELLDKIAGVEAHIHEILEREDFVLGELNRSNLRFLMDVFRCECLDVLSEVCSSGSDKVRGVKIGKRRDKSVITRCNGERALEAANNKKRQCPAAVPAKRRCFSLPGLLLKLKRGKPKKNPGRRCKCK